MSEQNVEKVGLTAEQRHAIARLMPGAKAEVVPTGLVYDWTCQAVFAEVENIIARAVVTGGKGSGSTQHEGEEQHQDQAQRLPGLQAGQRNEGDRQPGHGDDGVPVVRVREHDSSGLTVTVADIPGLGLGTKITRLLDEHWPGCRVNGYYLADLLRSEASRFPPAPLTPCGNRACTGCHTCLMAWSRADRANLEPWQARDGRSLPPARGEPLVSDKSGLDVLAEHLAEMLYERTMEWSRDEWVMWEHLTDGERTHWRGVAATEADRLRAALPVEWSIRYPLDAPPRAFVERCGAREVGPMAWRAYVVAGLLRYEGEHGTYASSRKGAERKAVRLLRKYLNSRGGAPIDVTALSIPPAKPAHD